jgi:cell division protein FtsL
LGKKTKTNALRGVAQLATDAVTGRLGIFMMMLVCSSCAVVLLAYVLTQVYTGSLMENVSTKKRKERDLREKIGILTSEYTSLASRERISRICEKKLGMIEGDAKLVERFSVDPKCTEFMPRMEFTEEKIDFPKVLGSDIDGITEAMRK